MSLISTMHSGVIRAPCFQRGDDHHLIYPFLFRSTEERQRDKETKRQRDIFLDFVHTQKTHYHCHSTYVHITHNTKSHSSYHTFRHRQHQHNPRTTPQKIPPPPQQKPKTQNRQLKNNNNKRIKTQEAISQSGQSVTSSISDRPGTETKARPPATE